VIEMFSSLRPFFRSGILRLLHKALPINNRAKLAILIEKQNWILNRRVLSIEILRDWAENDPNAFHRFFWKQHLSYAKFHEESNAFENRELLLTRKMLFAQLRKCWEASEQKREVNSIFEVGCSQGFMLRYLETKLFPAAKVLEGIDIDDYALRAGSAYLKSHGSKIRLIHADMADIDLVTKEKKYDIIMCLGVLMYFSQQAATNVVNSMLSHCNGLVAIADLAYPSLDNNQLEHSEIRLSDGVHIHNIDMMIQIAGGEIVYRRWEGPKLFGGQCVYFVFSRPKIK
jgi:2-polyprenyl-3-methyl-5-hydroxy-6-metoxy-1,4-benzoquinol methylase